jgi:hypothetical protein
MLLKVPPAVLDDVLLLADGDLAVLIEVAHAASIDFRDVRAAADAKRAKSKRRPVTLSDREVGLHPSTHL